jgi:hypothetical protein
VRGGPKAARTILLFHHFLKVYVELGSYFLFLQEQIKGIIIFKSAQLCPVNDVLQRKKAVVSRSLVFID